VTFTCAARAEDMIAQADRAMYAIKQNGKNGVEYKLAS
jgi:GGDEF domain-containing protein